MWFDIREGLAPFILTEFSSVKTKEQLSHLLQRMYMKLRSVAVSGQIFFHLKNKGVILQEMDLGMEIQINVL